MGVNQVVTDTLWSPNFTPGRSVPLRGIVIHHWGGDGQSHDAVAEFLARPDGNTSAHYVASAGRVTQLVHDGDTAWHCPGMNAGGIGIECRPECSDGDFETVAALVAAIRDEWGDLPLSGHQDHYQTACPGRWEARLGELDARARAIQSGAPAGPETMSYQEEEMHFVRSVQSGTIYAITPTDVTAIGSAKVWNDMVKAYGLTNEYEVSLDDGDIAGIAADAAARRARLVAEVAATVGSIDPAKLAESLAPAIVPPLLAALAASGAAGLSPDQVRAAAEEAVRAVFADAAKEG